MSSAFESGYDYFAKVAGAVNAANAGAKIITEVEAEIEKLARKLEELGAQKRGIDQLQGFVAEEWHGAAFNANAILDGNRVRAVVNRDNGYASPDITLKRGKKIVKDISLKYHKDGTATAKAQAKNHGEALHNKNTAKGAGAALERGISESDPCYKYQDRLVPEDQLEEAHRYMRRKIEKERVNRPDQVDRYVETNQRLTDTVTDGKTHSKKLTRKESDEITREVKDGNIDLSSHGLSTEQLATAQKIVSASLKAGLSAAVIAAVLQAAPYIIDSVLEFMREGEIDFSGFSDGAQNVIGGSAASFVTGSLSCAITESMSAGLVGDALKNVSSTMIASATVVAFNALIDSIRVVRGDLSCFEMADNLTRNTFVVASSLAAGSAVQVLVPIPIMGYLLGSFVGSVIGGLAYRAGQSLFMSFAIEHGVTFFGLVEQDYELPDSVLKELGIDLFKYEEFEYETPQIDYFEPQGIYLVANKPKTITFNFPRRGVIGVGRIGYVA